MVNNKKQKTVPKTPSVTCTNNDCVVDLTFEVNDSEAPSAVINVPQKNSLSSQSSSINNKFCCGAYSLKDQRDKNL